MLLSKQLETSSHPLFKLDRVLEKLGVGNRILLTRSLPPLTTVEESIVNLYTESLTEAREHFKDQISLKSLWLFLNKLKLRYPDELFETLRHDDVVEVYSMENAQIFRSFTFFQHCSYTLEDLHFRPWYDLYERDPEIMKAAMQWLERVMKNELFGICHLDLPVHWIKETNSSDPFLLQLKYKVGTVLRSADGIPRGYLISNQIVSSRRGN